MGALQVVTQNPLQSKAFTWPISTSYLLSRIHYSVFTHANAVALFATFASEATSIKTHYKTSNHLPLDTSIPVQACNPIFMSLPEHVFKWFIGRNCLYLT
jgi:hypothetical protein